MSKPRTRAEMIEYLEGHERYWTASSINGNHSYSRCIKLRYIDFPSRKVEDTAYQMLDIPEAFDEVGRIMEEWGASNDWKYQAGFNGRSSGYIVMLRGGLRDGHPYTSYQSIGEGRDYTDWSTRELKDETDLVYSFDLMVDECIRAFIEFCACHTVEEQTVMVPTRIRVPVPKDTHGNT